MIKDSMTSIKKWHGLLFKRKLEKNPTSLDILKTNEGKKQTILNYTKFFLTPGFKPNSIRLLENEIRKENPKSSFFKKLLQPLSISGLIIVLIVIFIAVFAPWISPYSYLDISTNRFPGAFDPPSADHILGQTEYGRDVLARLIYGGRESLTAGLTSIFISFSLGIIFGLIAAYYGGVVDSIIMRFFDLILSFPGLILAMVFVAIFGRSMDVILFAYGLLGIPSFARLVRASVLQIKENLYIKAAKTGGALDFKVLFKHILPNAISPLIISVSYGIGGIILGIAGLTFIGLGEDYIVEWGRDINIASGNFSVAPWAVLWPGFAIAFTVLGFILLGDGLRDALDPKNTA